VNAPKVAEAFRLCVPISELVQIFRLNSISSGVNCVSLPEFFPGSPDERYESLRCNSRGRFPHRAFTFARLVVPAVNVVREDGLSHFWTAAVKSSVPAHWGGITLEKYAVPAVFIPRHEHPENFLHVVMNGAVKYEVNTRGRNLRFIRVRHNLLLPRGTVDEVNWTGPTQRTAVEIHTNLLTHALEETAHQTEIELTEHWIYRPAHFCIAGGYDG